MQNRRSEGVTVLALVAFFMGIFTVVTMVSYTYYLSTVMPITSYYRLMTIKGSSFSFMSGKFCYWYSMIGLTLGVLYCLSAYGVLKLKNGWRQMLILLSAAFIIFPFASFVYLAKAVTLVRTAGSLLSKAAPTYQTAYKLYSLELLLYHSIIVYIFNIIFFTRPRIKAQFVEV